MIEAVGPIKRKFAPWDDPTLKPFIRFENVTKRFGDFTAVDNLTLDIYEREFFALLGPSGCGKTTLMRMLAGFEQPTEGRILLDGKDLSGIPPYKRPANMMFQSYALFPHMTVEGNIAFGLKQEGMDTSNINTRVAEMLELVKLEKFAKRKPHQLSGGQRQRVALARSLAKRPKVLLLDEPLGALDKKLREETQFELMDIQMELGMTFLIVTHDQEEAMTVSDRIAVMNHGVIAQIGTASEIYEQPSSRYVADFVGDINLIDGTVAAVGDGTVTLHCAGVETLIVAEAGPGEVAVGAKAGFAIRPEKVQISLEAPPAGASNVLSGEVWDIGYLGDISVYRVRLAGGSIVKATVANLTRIVERPITWEDKVYLTWPADAGIILLK
ncbi:Spermidine/putrescine import ATP-binding protein PotA [Pleomorphomonas sp. T1.2MG-36]|uniref:ABC transporter ATP-binding protein n=1 Tax=Pleomorphomonas sp. T1.2MG-36 TaxID=3041167 RepID=UPI002477BC16|nr:ABC transporter ATP-binding protein [Pleomorphomonas sp. T1.2MG-36]CAI9410841.1 Spermidine/putrescine import ATP-binding protein PotA [Pleomorphomonas sp. T1.2MG-36]